MHTEHIITIEVLVGHALHYYFTLKNAHMFKNKKLLKGNTE